MLTCRTRLIALSVLCLCKCKSVIPSLHLLRLRTRIVEFQKVVLWTDYVSCLQCFSRSLPGTRYQGPECSADYMVCRIIPLDTIIQRRWTVYHFHSSSCTWTIFVAAWYNPIHTWSRSCKRVLLRDRKQSQSMNCVITLAIICLGDNNSPEKVHLVLGSHGTKYWVVSLIARSIMTVRFNQTAVLGYPFLSSLVSYRHF